MTATMNDRERERLLADLKALQGERSSIDHREYAFIQAARALGATWDRIADALSLNSPQAAQQRYQALGRRIGP